MKEEITTKLKRLNVSVDEDLHKKLKIEAVRQNITIAQFVIEAICEKLEKGENK